MYNLQSWHLIHYLLLPRKLTYSLKFNVGKYGPFFGGRIRSFSGEVRFLDLHGFDAWKKFQQILTPKWWRKNGDESQGKKAKKKHPTQITT